MNDVETGLTLSRWKRLCMGVERRSRLRAPRGPRNRSADQARFFREWLRDPVGTASVAPSGEALVALITREIGVDSGPVLELGPGTGVFTRALVGRGVNERELTLVEQNPTFAALLKARHPGATILTIDAATLDHVLEPDAPAFGAAVCGLGFRSMPAATTEAILNAAFARMQPDAALYLFTYGRRCSVSPAVLARLGLHAHRVGIAYRNLPPASVWRVTRTG
ncbi:SAM-dependent methyltransferase [Sphingomonas sp. Y38-1Y]|uniref:class I SAM-dependent methyltransferase n=1 Tax=Sphingomonas sp. Y38-1Y TaxID=3078265 RepID=UPI0028F142B8|nr:SAM-dependent methyltransferase [Sphingomonas sp. Y38-1Y]